MDAQAPGQGRFDWPLMQNNITRADAEAVQRFLGAGEPPILTQADNVRAFEREWSEWLGARYSVFVNSGSAANLLTLAALKWAGGGGEVLVPTLTWVSDIAAVIQNGFEPVFVDINPRTLGMDPEQALRKITPRTRALFLTHILGYNALTQPLLEGLRARNIPLVEDCCESYGATFGGRKIGTFGLLSNFSFYYAHHLSTIEGGMVCTNDRDCYERVRMLRSHGMVREATSAELRQTYAVEHPDLHPDFIFAYPAYNMRSTEINAVIGRSQLKRLDRNNELRKRNLDLFLKGLDPARFFTEFAVEGSCNYAFTLVLRDANEVLRDNVMTELRRNGVEFRRGTSGGGNQLRQPYLKEFTRALDLRDFPHVDHVHFFGFYIGNYPTLEESMIGRLCALLNAVPDSQRL
ncbi:MAG: DegT/DnrJ/EryC1/StrS aminotransferase family protein [Planctomycetota bacterium]|nr:DegT/DnrJ/EryC1/StrS aminotransferase family protein [Planctomycetota bacterium]